MEARGNKALSGREDVEEPTEDAVTSPPADDGEQQSQDLASEHLERTWLPNTYGYDETQWP
jgi:hypothetical protein